jgi:membrane protein implicated in regulation of membrane protease activity
MDAGDWLWVWLAAAVVLAFLELVTPFLFFMISFAGGAGLAALAAALDASVALQIGVFIIGSGVALLVLVPIGHRLAVAESDDAHEGAVRQIGRTAVVLEAIPAGRHDTGVVRLERQRWRAETDADAAIDAGTEVEVIAVRGTRLVVAPVRPPTIGTNAERATADGVSPSAASDAMEEE